MIKDEKAALRAQLRAAIASLPEGYIASSDAGIMENVLALAEFSAAGRVFAYFSVGRECATAGIIAAAVAAGKAVALPKTQGAGRMYFAAHTGALGAGRYGIPEPPAEAEALLPGRGDALIVPALCCDERSGGTACASVRAAAITTGCWRAAGPSPYASAASGCCAKKYPGSGTIWRWISS